MQNSKKKIKVLGINLESNVLLLEKKNLRDKIFCLNIWIEKLNIRINQFS